MIHPETGPIKGKRWNSNYCFVAVSLVYEGSKGVTGAHTLFKLKLYQKINSSGQDLSTYGWILNEISFFLASGKKNRTLQEASRMADQITD
jgi:hypothetical protein